MAATPTSLLDSISEALSSAQVPCILWGHMMLSVHGIPTMFGSLDFIIADADLDTTRQALLPLPNLSMCKDSLECPYVPQAGSIRSPAVHMHVDASTIRVNLYLQSGTLWFLPPLTWSRISAHEPALPPYLIDASDPASVPPEEIAGGCGPLPPRKRRVLLPRDIVALEAYIRMVAIDFGALDVAHPIAMVAYYSLYVVKKDRLDLNELPGALRTFYEQFCGDWDRSLRAKIIELKNAVGIAMEDLDDD